jgi:hypothetical protein
MKINNFDNILQQAKTLVVENLHNKNQFVISGYGFTCFQSYETLIAIYDEDNSTLYLNATMWDYSKTTSKHLKIFINEYTNLLINDTKELRKLIKKHKVLTFNI